MDQMTNIVKKTSINILLAVVFFLVLALIMIPFLAELNYMSAERLKASYRWDAAQRAYMKAMRMDSLNARYCGEYAKFCRQCAYWSYERSRLLEEANKYFTKAIALDPENADFYLGRGLAALASAGRDNGLIEKSFEDLERAKERDPNSSTIAYQIGVGGMDKWSVLDSEQKDFVLGRLAFYLRIAPSVGAYIYTRTWASTKDFTALLRITPKTLESQRALYEFIVSRDLWQFRNSQAGVVDRYSRENDSEKFADERLAKKKRIEEIKSRYVDNGDSRGRANNGVSTEAWFGVAGDGKNKYSDGFMFWNGTMDAVIEIPEGDAAITISARGSPANGVYPYMIVELDGDVIGETFVASEVFKDYTFYVHTEGGMKVVSVTFVNDRGNTKEDRNLFIGKAEAVNIGK